MRVAALGSGSRGNSLLVEAGSTRLLVDAGLSGRQIERRLAALEVEPESVAAIIVTHEHRDHTRGVGVAARRWGPHHAIVAARVLQWPRYNIKIVARIALVRPH